MRRRKLRDENLAVSPSRILKTVFLVSPLKSSSLRRERTDAYTFPVKLLLAQFDFVVLVKLLFALLDFLAPVKLQLTILGFVEVALVLDRAQLNFFLFLRITEWLFSVVQNRVLAFLFGHSFFAEASSASFCNDILLTRLYNQVILFILLVYGHR